MKRWAPVKVSPLLFVLLHYVAQVIWHALQKMLVTFRQDATLIFSGNTEPAALAELYYAAGGQ